MGTKTSNPLIESVDQEPFVVRAGSFFQKRGLARNIRDGVSPAEHVESACPLVSPVFLAAKLARDVEQAICFVAETPHGLRGRERNSDRVEGKGGQTRRNASPRASRSKFFS